MYCSKRNESNLVRVPFPKLQMASSKSPIFSFRLGRNGFTELHRGQGCQTAGRKQKWNSKFTDIRLNVSIFQATC